MTDLARLYIDGKWRDGAGGRTHPVLDPATGEQIGEVAHAEISDLDLALEAVGRGFATWRSTSTYDRARLMRRAAEQLRANAPAIAARMTAEQGKPLAESKAEAAAAADILEWGAEEGRRAYGWTIPARQPGIMQTAVPEPVGPVAAFTPWNFPLNQPMRKIAAALAAGCSMVIKGSEETPASLLAIIAAFEQAGLPPGVLNAVFGTPAEISEHLIESPVIRKVSFTGSTPVGRQLAALAGQHLKRITLELGGHAPVLVFEDADLESAVQLSAAAKFRNAGQVCTAPTRFVVQRPAFERFVSAFAAKARAQVLGPGSEAATTMGPLSNERRLGAMQALVDDAVGRGAELVTGGQRRGNRGFFYEPTVLANVPLDARIMNEEPFGPIAMINPFASLEDGLAEANRLPYGLAAYAYARHPGTIAAVVSGIESGMVSVNHHGLATPETPFGGVKDSGQGTEGGAEMLAAYFNTKFATVRIPA